MDTLIDGIVGKTPEFRIKHDASKAKDKEAEDVQLNIVIGDFKNQESNIKKR